MNIPNGVTCIEAKTFSDCKCLASVTIPRGVTSIGTDAFAGSMLTRVEIPDSVTSIGNRAFSCWFLSEVTIPNGVTSIGDEAFSWCNSLHNVNIPDSVTSIGDGACFLLIGKGNGFAGRRASLRGTVFFCCPASFRRLRRTPLTMSLDGPASFRRLRRTPR